MVEWEEVFNAVREHKVRSIITSIGVIWGIFILMLLVGFGNGLESGIHRIFGDFSQNSLWVHGGMSKPDNAFGAPRSIVFDTTTLNLLRKKYSRVKYISPEATLDFNRPVVYKNEMGFFLLKGVYPDFFKIKLLKIKMGRSFNTIDEHQKRLSVIIGSRVVKHLFHNTPDPVGRKIQIGTDFFTVVGVLEEGTILDHSEANSIFFPYTSFCERFGSGMKFSTMAMVIRGHSHVDKIEEELRSFLSRNLGFHFNDKNSLFFLNYNKQTASFDKLFNSIKYFLWFIGISLLTSGMVGISNIMFILVKERTKEIGIRKAVGAKATTILKYILIESTVVTFLAGLTGITLGVVIIFIINTMIAYLYKANDLLINHLSIDIYSIFGALFILILAGMLAGLIPARKAANVDPIEAIRQD